MKIILLLLLIISLCPSLLSLQAESDAIINQYRLQLETGQYSEAQSTLSKALRTFSNQPNRRNLYLKTLGDFNRRVCGDMRKALSFYNRVISSPGIDETLKQAAIEMKQDIQLMQKRNRQLDNQLNTMRIRAGRKRETESILQDIETLKMIYAGNPRYYRLHEIFFTMALNYDWLNKPGSAYDYYKKALTLKPGIIFYLPVKIKAEQANAAYYRNLINDSIKIILWVLLLVTMFLFYRSKPWHRLCFKHLFLLGVLLLGWWLVFQVSHSVIGAGFDHAMGGRAQKPDAAKDIEFISAAPGSPGSQVVKPLFHYGIIGVFAIFIFSLAVQPLKAKKTIVILTGLYGFLLFSALTTHFYMRHCDTISTYKAGTLQFNGEEPEPNVLTNPLAYPGLEIPNITDPYVGKWVGSHCPEAFEGHEK